jgi:hypothetical protein
VSLLDVVNDDEITWDEDEILEPERQAVPAAIKPHQMDFPTLPAHQRVLAGQQANLTQGMNNLKMDDSVKPAPWGATNTSKDLFPAAKATPATDEWQNRQQELNKQDKKSNILTFQFWNPASPDYDPHRFYDPIIEKHRCPFPTCDAYFEKPEECQKYDPCQIRLIITDTNNT